MIQDPEAIRIENSTLQGKLEFLVVKYREVWPEIHENYRLLDFLYLRDFERLPISREVLDMAARGELVNLSSLHRALRFIKKKWQSSEQKTLGKERDEAHKVAFRDGGPPPTKWRDEL